MITDWVQVILVVIQLVIGFPLWKYLFKIQYNITRTDKLEKDLEKFKVEIRGKIKETDDAIETALDELTENITFMERTHRQEASAFQEVLSRLNITLTEFKTTVKHLNETIVKNDLQVNKYLDRIYQDFADHKKTVNQRIDDIKSNL